MPGQVQRSALPNDLPTERLRLRSDAEGSVAVDPSRAGWRYLAFRVSALAPGVSLGVGAPGSETAVVLVEGADLEVEAPGHPPAVLPGRSSPFDALAAAWYLPPGLTGELRPRVGGDRDDCVVAIASAPGSGREGVASGPVVIRPETIRIEVRGAGNATRQINHIIEPDFPADRLEVVEVLTPSGNWSSWPPHKHDVDDMPTEAVLEEVYYYRFRRPEAWGVQRLYRRPGTPAAHAAGPRDCLWEVRQGDVVVVTDGYHPFVAAHGDDAYYLNALAGDRRTMACSFDPDLDHVRAAWRSMSPDPRVPLVRR